MKKNQKGFTLVELVIVMAILSIIGIAIYGFFHTSSTAYNKTGAEVDLQYEAQLTLNQLDNMIIDSTKQLDYYYHTVSANNQPILSDADIPPEANVTGKTFIITNEDVAYKIDWDSATKKVNLTKMTSTVSSNSLMAEYVSGFHVSLKRVKSQRVVEFHFDFMNKDKEYDTAHNVTMRNKTIVNGVAVSGNEVKQWWAINEVKIFRGDQDVTDKTISVTSTGIEQHISLKAKVIGINNPSQDVVWTIAGNTDSATTISGNTANPCTVILGANESGDSIMVTATAVAKNGEDKKGKNKASTRIKILGGAIVQNENGLVRGGKFTLVADQLAGKGKIVWGFKKILRKESWGEMDETTRWGRRIPQGESSMVKVDALWADYYDKDRVNELDKDGNGLVDFYEDDYRLMGPEDKYNPDKTVVLRENSDGTCTVESGRAYYNDNALNFSAEYYIEIEARAYDAEGNFKGSQKFGFGDGNPPLLMKDVKISFKEVDIISGNLSPSSTSVAGTEYLSKNGSFRIEMNAGEERSFFGLIQGIAGGLVIEPAENEASKCFNSININQRTGLVTFNVKDVTEDAYQTYKICITDNSYGVESSKEFEFCRMDVVVKKR